MSESTEGAAEREAAPSERTSRRAAPRRAGRPWSWRPGPVLQGLVIAFVLMVIVRTLLVQTFSVPSTSMQPTLEPGDRILVNRLVRGPSIERGDVVVFDGTGSWGPPAGATDVGGLRARLQAVLSWISFGSGADYVKRVIGVPGDHVVCCDVDGRITVNGIPLAEPYLYPGDEPSATRFDVTVPAGRIWVMGDHRSVSADSRSKLGRPGGGMVPLDDVVGRAWLRYWPTDRLGSLASAPVPAGSPPQPEATTP